jgi:ADP-ribose pyrophosphatase
MGSDHSPIPEHVEMSKPDEPSLQEIPLSSESVFDGVLLKVHRDAVRLPDGSNGIREYIRHPGAVLIVAQQPDRRLLLVRQYRYALGRSVLEMPAGRIEPGEDLDTCARRELVEETGFEARDWQHLGTVHPCLGYSDERIEIFLARDLTEVGARPDEDEFLQILSMDLDALEEAVRAGEITDAKTLCALFLAGPSLKQS